MSVRESQPWLGKLGLSPEVGEHLREEGRRAGVWFPKCFYSDGRRSTTTVMLGQRHASSTKRSKLKNEQLMNTTLKGSRMRQPQTRTNNFPILKLLLIVFHESFSFIGPVVMPVGPVSTNISMQFI